MARGGGGPDSSPDAPGGGMGADAFGGDGGGGSSAGPSGRGGRSLGAIGASATSGGPNLSMDGRATPAEMDAMDIMDDVDRARAVRDALGAISVAQNQARDVARANAVRDAQRNIALAQAKAMEQAKLDIPTITITKFAPKFDYGPLRNPPFATRSPTKAGLFGPSFEETKAINEAKKSANRNRVKEYAKSYKARIDDIDKQLKNLLDKSMMNLFSKEYRELLDKKNNLMSHPNYNYVAHFDPSLRTAQTVMGTLAPGPLGLGPTLQDKAIDLGFIDDTPISEIENQDRQSVLEGDRGGNFYDYTFSAK